MYNLSSCHHPELESHHVISKLGLFLPLPANMWNIKLEGLFFSLSFLLFVFPAENLKEALSFHCNSTSRPGPLPVSEEQKTSDTTTQLEATLPAPSPPPVPAEEEPQAADAVRSEEEELREDSLELQLRNQSSTTDNHNMYLKVKMHSSHPEWSQGKIKCHAKLDITLLHMFAVTSQLNISQENKDTSQTWIISFMCSSTIQQGLQKLIDKLVGDKF